ncbi:MAG: hypothetical protein ACFFEF_17595 [Candidatus Thorarchaeota archaeon]
MSGVGPRVVAIFMIMITLFPLGVMPVGEEFWITYSVFWILVISPPYIIFDIMMFGFLWLIIPLYIFSILYIRQIVRFFYGISSRDSALMCGLLSILFPTLVGIGASVLLGLPYRSYLYIFPIPVQFLAGLVFLYRFREPENVSAWSGQFMDWSWWIRLKPKWSNWGTDIIETYFEEEDMIMNMSLTEVEEYYKARRMDE